MENKAVQIFNFNEANVTVIIDDRGDPWRIAKEVCEVLGISKYRGAIAKLDPDEMCPVRLDGIQGRGNPIRTAVNEPGLYQLIMRSDKPQAKAFRRWITHVVLPMIRKAGGLHSRCCGDGRP